MTDDWLYLTRKIASEHGELFARLGSGVTVQLAQPRHTGTVKWFDRKKGHGFIVADDPAISDGRDIFVHYSAIEGEGYRVLYEGSRVSFTLHDFGKGPQARSVRELR